MKFGINGNEQNTNDFVIDENNILRKYKGKDSDVVIPDNVFRIGSFAFESCKNVRSVTIPSSVITIGRGAFADCINLTTVTVANGVYGIDESAFENCKSLRSIDISSSGKHIEYVTFHLL